MPLEVPIEKLLAIAGSKYVLSTVVAKRAKQINAGAKVLVDDISGKPISISFREVAAGVVEYETPETDQT
jgi:DNA-directed RNA polymerase subunit omega